MENTAEYDSNAVSDMTMSHSVLGISVWINQDGQFACGSLLPPAIIHLPPAASNVQTCNIFTYQHSCSSPVSSLWQNVLREPCVFVSVISASFLETFSIFFNFTATSHTVKLTSVACDTLFTWLNTNKSITHLLEKKTMISFRAFFYLYAVDVGLSVCMTSKDRNTLSYPNYVLVNSKNVLLQLQLRYCCHIDSTINVLPTPLVNPSLSNYLHLQYVPRVCLLI